MREAQQYPVWTWRFFDPGEDESLPGSGVIRWSGTWGRLRPPLLANVLVDKEWGSNVYVRSGQDTLMQALRHLYGKRSNEEKSAVASVGSPHSWVAAGKVVKRRVTLEGDDSRSTGRLQAGVAGGASGKSHVLGWKAA